MPSQDTWGLEQAIKDVAAAVASGLVIDGMDADEIAQKLESIDEHVVEAAEAIPAAIDRLTEQLALLRQDLTERG